MEGCIFSIVGSLDEPHGKQIFDRILSEKQVSAFLFDLSKTSGITKDGAAWTNKSLEACAKKQIPFAVSGVQGELKSAWEALVSFSSSVPSFETNFEAKLHLERELGLDAEQIRVERFSSQKEAEGTSQWPQRFVTCKSCGTIQSVQLPGKYLCYQCKGNFTLHESGRITFYEKL